MMIAMGCDNEQPIDLSIGSRAETPARNQEPKISLQNGTVPKQENPDFLTPVVSFSSSSSISGFRPSPTVPEPPSKRSFDDMQSEFWYSATPPTSSASSSKYCAPSTSSPRSSFKKARLHSPERKRFLLDFNRVNQPSSPPATVERSGSPLLPSEFKVPTMTRIQKSPRVRSSREKSPMCFGGNQAHPDSPLNGYIPGYRSVSNSPAYSDEHQLSHNPRLKIPEVPSSYLRELSRNNGIPTNILEALRTAKDVHPDEHQDDPSSAFTMENLFNSSRWPHLEDSPSGTSAPANNAPDNLYQTYMYLNYLPYLLYGKTEAERRRLQSLREPDHPGHQVSPHQREVSSSLNNLYSSYLTSLLTGPEHQQNIQPESSAPSHVLPPTTAPPPTSTSNLINSHPFLFGQSQSPIASSSSFSSHVVSPRGKHVKKISTLSENAPSTSWGASAFSPGFPYPDPSGNHRFADFPIQPNKKPFVRASSFDENLVRSHADFGSAERILNPDFYDKKHFARLGCSSRDNSHLFRWNSSLPNLPVSILESHKRSLEHNADLSGVGELLSKLSDKPLPESVRETHGRNDMQNKNINMINIHNFNSIKDLYSINDVHKFIQGNINETFPKRETSETCPDAMSSSPGFHSKLTEGDLEVPKLTQSNTTNDVASTEEIVSEDVDNGSSSSSGVCIRKKPSRALTGRHVRSGTGASISTLASLREKLKERRNQAPTSTPTTSRSTTRGRGRRRHLAL